MTTLYKRATPSQVRILRAVEGAVKNAVDAHPGLEISPRHRRSIAKRAAGTLTAGWPDVLAAKATPPSDRRGLSFEKPEAGSSDSLEVSRSPYLARSARAASETPRRGPFAQLRSKMVRQMTAIRISGQMDRYEAWQDVLRMMAEIERSGSA